MINDINLYLKDIAKLKNLRTLKNIKIEKKFIIYNNKKLINLSSNDYLGLKSNYSFNINFLEQYIKKNKSHFLGSFSSRLLSGNHASYTKLENLLKNIYNKEILIFNSGYHANLTLMTIFKPFDVIFYFDKSNHASLYDGLLLSNKKFFRFKHKDYIELEKLLQENRSKSKYAIIVSDMLFSMDGDFADIQKLIELKNKYNALLYIDEAHTFGVFGNGYGFCFEKDLYQQIDIIIATFSKAIGALGGFAIIDKPLKNLIIEQGRSFIYSTALPPIILEYVYYVLKNYKKFGAQRKKLFYLTELISNSKLFKNEKNSYICIYSIQNTKIPNTLFEKGFFCPIIEYPTVPKDKKILRISLNADLDESDLEKFINILKNYAK